MSDLTKSLKEIFDERISSPFYGSLIVSWLLWNWEILYVTFFVDQSRLGDSLNKIEYIFNHCSSPWHLAVFPVLSTLAIIFLLPYVTNYASYVTAKFDRKRKDKQIEIDRTQVLTIEQSLKILSDAQKQKEEFRDLLSSRDEQIKVLTQQLELSNQQLDTVKLKKVKEAIKSNNSPELSLSQDLTDFFNNRELVRDFDQITDNIEAGRSNFNVSKSSLKYCVAYGLIELDRTMGNAYYNLTEKGKLFVKVLSKEKDRDSVAPPIGIQ